MLQTRKVNTNIKESLSEKINDINQLMDQFTQKMKDMLGRLLKKNVISLKSIKKNLKINLLEKFCFKMPH